MPAPAIRAGVVARIAPKLLNPDPDNPRSSITERSVTDLAASVKARGVLVPLLVRKAPGGKLVVKDGHRRLAAAKLAKVKDVPVLLTADDDTAQLRLDQVAVNQLHEHLQPMDTARMLRKLRGAEKLTANDLAARMAKAGTPMSAKDIEASIALTELPDWAQTMIDREQLALDAAPAVLAASRDPAVPAKDLRARLGQVVGWRGVVKKADVPNQVGDIYRANGISLTSRWGHTEKARASLPHFDWRKVCKGCEHLRTSPGDAYCMNGEGFKQHNEEAKAAGLGLGGEKPTGKAREKLDPSKPLTKRQQEKLEAEKAERKAKVDGTRAEGYLDQWLRDRVALALPARVDVAEQLVLWLASSRPDAGLLGNGYLGSGAEMRYLRALRTAAGRAPRLDAFLAAAPTASEVVALAIHGLPLLIAPQIRELAMKLGITVEMDWRADQPYVLLRTREQLAEWLAKYGLDDAGKVGELRQRLLDHPHTLEFTKELPHMLALHEAFVAPIRDEARAAQEISDRDDQLQDDEDQAYDDEADGEDDDPPHGPGEDTNVEDCVSYADEEVDA